MIILFTFIYRLLKTDYSKNIWTAIASVPLPTCFVAKDDIPVLSHAGNQFHKFYKWNSLLFCILSNLTLVGLNAMLYFNVFLTYNCSNLPFMSCQNGSIPPKECLLENCPEMCDRLTKCDSDSNPHFSFLIYGNVAVFTLSTFHTIVVWIQNLLCPSLRGDAEWFMRPM